MVNALRTIANDRASPIEFEKFKKKQQLPKMPATDGICFGEIRNGGTTMHFVKLSYCTIFCDIAWYLQGIVCFFMVLVALVL